MSKDSLSDEDKALFRQMMSGVKPLPDNNRADLSPPRKVWSKPKRDHGLSIDHPPNETIFLSDNYPVEVQANTVLSYCQPGLPGKRLRELKIGQIPWQARLDLHGLRLEEARQALIHFILQQIDMKHRCLLIIHGKGNHNGEAPILKNLIYHWLPQFPKILAFHSALPKDGGCGALYVLLKRQRELNFSP